jgi:1-pyrroline-5-carboxylate dehydrogenase
MIMSSIASIPVPRNEPVLHYAPGSAERASLKARINAMLREQVDIPCVVGGKDVRGGKAVEVVVPHCHRHVLARVHQAGGETIHGAIEAANAAQREWAQWKFEDRAAVFLRAADLLAGPWRATLNAATMLGQSKTAHQAEIDSACELIDFLRFNVHFAERLYREQPESTPGVWNRMDHRPLEGFVYAITPFNFTAIGGNLPTAPALLGNVVVWKPAGTATLSNYFFLRLLEEAGLPPGVINFIPGSAAQVSDIVLADRTLAGIHFTGSTEVFQTLWKKVSDRLEHYATYPRLVGETGGKDFIAAHSSADPQALAVGLVRGAFEYQGQKCSAASRAYVPDNLWPEVKDRVLEMVESIKMGDVADFRNFMGAVIDQRAFDRIKAYIDQARNAPGVRIIAGGKCDATSGYFVEPTILQVDDPMYRTMCEEIFGPVLTIHVYPAARWSETLDLVDRTSPYSLTGAVFARDRGAVLEADRKLRNAAGNFYINDKPTGAVVGQQPFGGARASGTNDKAGSILNLVRWISPRTIKETFVPPADYRYPFMEDEEGGI